MGYTKVCNHPQPPTTINNHNQKKDNKKDKRKDKF